MLRKPFFAEQEETNEATTVVVKFSKKYSESYYKLSGGSTEDHVYVVHSADRICKKKHLYSKYDKYVIEEKDARLELSVHEAVEPEKYHPSEQAVPQGESKQNNAGEETKEDDPPADEAEEDQDDETAPSNDKKPAAENRIPKKKKETKRWR